MKAFEFIGKSLYLKKEKVLVIADLHLGYELSLEERGIRFPRSQFKEIKQDLGRIFEKLEREEKKIKEIVILGDLKHEFARISGQEREEILELIDILEKKGKLILIKGNHDSILEPIARQKGIELKEFYVKGENCFVHGDKDQGLWNPINKMKKIKRIILGHKHPAVIIKKGAKKEKYKCFLAGKWRGKEVIILPSFFPIVEGSDVFASDTKDRGFLKSYKINLKRFEVYVPVSVDETLDFGKLGEIE